MPHDAATEHAETATMVRLSDQLTTALRALIAASPLSGLGPIEAARMLGVDKTLTSRLMAALRASDPLAALSALPGTAPLRQFVRAARKHGAEAVATQAAEAELRAFDRELQRSFGTRTRLDAALADALPKSRRRHEEGARQSIYRGMALIKGVSIDLSSVTWIVHPARDNPEQVDILVLAAFVGVRRLRPTARIRFASSHESSHPEGGATLVREFCRPADLDIAVSREDVFTFYDLSSGPVRRDATADVFLTEVIRGAAADPSIFGDSVVHPCKRLALSMIVHESVWPACGFSVRAYDTALRGLVQLPDPLREYNRLPIDSSIVRSPANTEALRTFPIPNYPDIVRRLTSSLGWDISGARMFSCEVVYPVYGSLVVLARE